jgi:tRNA (adenine37-N6)-methyltransferase
MPMTTIVFRPIGIIRSPFLEPAGTPIQASGATGVRGTVHVDPEFVPGLDDLSGFSHIILIYQFHRAAAPRLRVVPFLDSREHGVFATRAPARPNPLGFSVVRLLSVDAGTLEIENVDILDSSPLLDIKPYVPAFDSWQVTSLGWLSECSESAVSTRSDDRFDPK